jgi:hypothetical protein
MSGTLVTEIKQAVQLKKKKSWLPITPKQRERCLGIPTLSSEKLHRLWICGFEFEFGFGKIERTRSL